MKPLLMNFKFQDLAGARSSFLAHLPASRPLELCTDFHSLAMSGRNGSPRLKWEQFGRAAKKLANFRSACLPNVNIPFRSLSFSLSLSLLPSLALWLALAACECEAGRGVCLPSYFECLPPPLSFSFSFRSLLGDFF